MAFSVIAGTNGGNTNTNETSHTINFPTPVASGDLLIVGIAVDGSTSVDWPAGWTELHETNSGGAVDLAIAYRFADGTEGLTTTVTTGAVERTAHNSYRITGWEGAPVIATPAIGLSAAPNPPSLTLPGPALDVLWLVFCAHDDGQLTVSVAPTNYSNLINNRSDNTAGVGIGSAERQFNSTNDDPGAFTISGADDWVAQTVAIKPKINIPAWLFTA